MRKTEYSAGYDLVAAEDIVIPSYYNMMEETLERLTVEIAKDQYLSLENMAELTK
jgi:dUTPase